MIAVVALVVPLLPDKAEDHRQFCAELVGSRREEYEASRKRLGITREAAWHQETPNGTVSVICLEANDLGSAAQGMGASSDPFDVWFRERVREYTASISRPLGRSPSRSSTTGPNQAATAGEGPTDVPAGCGVSDLGWARVAE